jgi:hypothetical protein
MKGEQQGKCFFLSSSKQFDAQYIRVNSHIAKQEVSTANNHAARLDLDESVECLDDIIMTSLI